MKLYSLDQKSMYKYLIYHHALSNNNMTDVILSSEYYDEAYAIIN